MLTALLFLVQPPPQAPVDFVKDVQPILRQHCWQCHGVDKQKGDLRLDLRSAVFHDDRDLWTVVPNAPDDSLLIERIKLPADDPDHMPAKADPLPAAQIALLERWIAEGAKWPESSDAAAVAAPLEVELPEVALSAEQRATRDHVLAALQRQRIPAGRVAADTDAVDVNLSLRGAAVVDTALAELRGLEPCLTRLNLSRTGITDAGLEALTGMKHLERLNLSRTAIGDAGIAHIDGLERLSYLNLFGTAVTDVSLIRLVGMPGLRKLFLWQTGVSEAGVEAFRASRPDVTVDRGGYAASITALAKERAEAAEAAKKSGINSICPVTNQPADPALFVEFKGRKIAVCCEKCKARVAKEPAKFAAVLDAAAKGKKPKKKAPSKKPLKQPKKPRGAKKAK